MSEQQEEVQNMPLSDQGAQDIKEEALFDPKLMMDSRLMNTESLLYSVSKGAQNFNTYKEAASSATTSSMIFSTRVPGYKVCVDSQVFISTTLTFTVTGRPAAGQYLVNYSLSDCVGPFPLHQLMNNCSVSINSANVSTDIANTLDVLLHNMPHDLLDKYSDMTPTLKDYYYNNSDNRGALNSVFAGSTGARSGFTPRGAYPVTITGNAVGDGATDRTVTIVMSVCEPLLCAPFTVGHSKSLHDIETIKVIIGLNANCQRLFRSSNGVATVSTLTAVNDTNIHYMFLTPHPSTEVGRRNVHMFPSISYHSSQAVTVNAGANKQVQTASFNISGIPLRMYLFARVQQAYKTSLHSDSFLPISNVSIQFGNQAGILSNASPYQLYQMSKRNGLDCSYQQFRGIGQMAAAGGITQQLLLTGSPVILEFGKDINLSDDWAAPGIGGQNTLYVTAQVDNNTVAPLANVELSIITVHASMMVSMLGNSTVFENFLTSDQVLTVSKEGPYNASEPFQGQLTGGSWWNSIRSFWKKNKKYATGAKNVLNKVPHPYAQLGAKALGMAGAGMSAGGRSAGGRYSGRFME